VKYRITDHAIERYCERVKPALSLLKCKLEMEGLIERFGGQPQDAPPPWLNEDPAKVGRARYLLLTDDIAFAIVGRLVTTVLVAGGCSEETKAYRAAKKQRAKERKAARRRASESRPLPHNLKSRIEGESWPI